MDFLPADYPHQWDRIFTNSIDNTYGDCTGETPREVTEACSSSVHSGPPSYNQRVISSSTSSTTTYHIYHEGYQEHILITPVPKPPKKNKKNKAKADETSGQDLASIVAKNSYFVHKPYLSFHDPPRTLRRGPLKNGAPFCLIQSNLFWRKWKLQFGDDLAKVIDPRGVVGWDRLHPDGGTNDCFRSCFRNDGTVSARDDASDDDGRALKGYKVRSWRLWGESGKQYHREVNARRKSLSDQDKLAQQEEAVSTIEEWSPYIPPPGTPYQADEVVYLTWMSPFSKDTRRYHFSYAGVDFYWKGTRDTSLTSDTKRPLRAFTTYNHLKLVGRIPPGSGFVVFHDTLDAEEGSNPSTKQGREDEVVLAHFTSELKSRKYGVLFTYDDAIAEFQQRFVQGCGQDYTGPFEEKKEEARCTESGIHQTRFYEVIMATAMCMILGEWEKRQVVKHVIASIIGAASAS